MSGAELDFVMNLNKTAIVRELSPSGLVFNWT